jgi:hypothetical protein
MGWLGHPRWQSGSFGANLIHWSYSFVNVRRKEKDRPFCLVQNAKFACLSTANFEFCTRNYINHFIQPDTIIPGVVNPKSWNRYSYVLNNPIRNNDPTGHICVGDSGECLNENGSTGGGFTNGGNPTHHYMEKEPGGHKPGAKGCGGTYAKRCDGSDIWDAAWDTWTTTSYPWSFPVSGSWSDQAVIESREFEQMLKIVGDDLQGFPTLGWYDTPFYNAGGNATGIGCVNGKCYDRSELNYIGEGEALAKLGLSKEITHQVVFVWKNKLPLALGLLGLESTTNPVSQGTYEMTDIGWDYYNANYAGIP